KYESILDTSSCPIQTIVLPSRLNFSTIASSSPFMPPPPFINFQSADSLLVFLHVHILSATHSKYCRYLHLLTLLGGSIMRLLQVRGFCRRCLFLVPILPLLTCAPLGLSALD